MYVELFTKMGPVQRCQDSWCHFCRCWGCGNAEGCWYLFQHLDYSSSMPFYSSSKVPKLGRRPSLWAFGHHTDRDYAGEGQHESSLKMLRGCQNKRLWNDNVLTCRFIALNIENWLLPMMKTGAVSSWEVWLEGSMACFVIIDYDKRQKITFVC